MIIQRFPHTRTATRPGWLVALALGWTPCGGPPNHHDRHGLLMWRAEEGFGGR